MFDVSRLARDGIAAIQPYVPGLTDDELKVMYGLSQVVKLNANENALGPSPLAVEAVRQELPSAHHYPDGASGLLRQAIAEFHSVSEANVLVGNGSDDLIKLLSETFLEEGDEVVVPFPSFSQYTFGASIMRANVKSVPLRADFTIDVEAMVAQVTDKTKLLYVCSPNNPTGDVLTMDAAHWLLNNLPEQVVVIMDLAYNDYSLRTDRVQETEALLADPRVAVIHTFSKLYGLAGLRVGYGLAHPDLWSYVNRVREPFNVNRLAQRAAVAALSDVQHRQASIAHAQKGREFYQQLSKELGYVAQATEGNFILINTGDGKRTMEQLMQRGVLVRTGFAGLAEYVRITFGTEEENALCAEALRRSRG